MFLDVGVHSIPQPLTLGSTSAHEAVTIVPQSPLSFGVGVLNCSFVDAVFATKFTQSFNGRLTASQPLRHLVVGLREEVLSSKTNAWIAIPKKVPGVDTRETDA